MRKSKLLLSLFLAAALSFPTSPAVTNNTAVVEAAAKKVAITNAADGTLTIEKGESYKLKANRSDVKWKSSNPKNVTVNKTGNLKGKNYGNSTITASAGKSKAKVAVTVGTKISRVNVVKPAVALLVGGQSTIKADITPENASNKTLNYKSKNADIATVSKEGVITAKKTGKTQITVKSTDGTKKSETITVTVRTEGSIPRLQDDFYSSINATTIKDHALSENQMQWSGFYDLSTNITNSMNNIIDNLAAKKDDYSNGTIEQKITDFYLLARDMETRDAAGVKPLKEYTDKVDNAKTVEEYVDVLAELLKYGHASVLGFGISPDLTDSNKYILVNAGPDHILPKNYMVDAEYKLVQDAVFTFIKQMFTLAGESESSATEIATQVFKFEQELAANDLDISDMYDINKAYRIYTSDELVKLYSNCDIKKLLKTIGITHFDKCMVSGEENIKKINSMLTQENLELLKNYTKFTLYMNCCNYLTSAHYDALSSLNAIILGPSGNKTMDTVAKEMTQSLFSWEFGKLYVDNYFSEESKKEIESMTQDIIETFRNRIKKLDWLSDATKQKAINKLNTMKVKIGYPDKWPSYFENISIDASMGLVENLMQITMALNSDIQSLLDSGVDKTQWAMTPQTVNACYTPQANDITFPAAILQAPFYDKDASYAQNLGGIGTVIGHEITHAFDTSGAEFDENGNYNNWWTEADFAEFMSRAEKVKNYYNSIELSNGLFQNGDLTITENIADMGAMACALDIAGSDKKAQLEIFKSNANIWASNYTDQYRDYLLTNDVHSLDKVRVNAILPLFDQFYDVFGVREDDAMYVAPEDRVQVW